MSAQIFLYIMGNRTLWVPGHTPSAEEKDPVITLNFVTQRELSRSFYLFDAPVQVVTDPRTAAMTPNGKTPQEIQRAVAEFRRICTEDHNFMLRRCYNAQNSESKPSSAAAPTGAPAVAQGGTMYPTPPSQQQQPQRQAYPVPPQGGIQINPGQSSGSPAGGPAAASNSDIIRQLLSVGTMANQSANPSGQMGNMGQGSNPNFYGQQQSQGGYQYPQPPGGGGGGNFFPPMMSNPNQGMMYGQQPGMAGPGRGLMGRGGMGMGAGMGMGGMGMGMGGMGHGPQANQYMMGYQMNSGFYPPNQFGNGPMMGPGRGFGRALPGRGAIGFGGMRGGIMPNPAFGFAGARRDPDPIDVRGITIPKDILSLYSDPSEKLMLATMSAPHFTVWLRSHEIPTNVKDPKYVFCKGGIVLMLKATGDEVKDSKPVLLFERQACTHFLIHNYCGRTNCLHEHHTEEQLRTLIAARHVELKGMTKKQRQDLVDDLLRRDAEAGAEREVERQEREAARRVTVEPTVSVQVRRRVGGCSPDRDEGQVSGQAGTAAPQGSEETKRKRSMTPSDEDATGTIPAEGGANADSVAKKAKVDEPPADAPSPALEAVAEPASNGNISNAEHNASESVGATASDPAVSESISNAPRPPSTEPVAPEHVVAPTGVAAPESEALARTAAPGPEVTHEAETSETAVAAGTDDNGEGADAEEVEEEGGEEEEGGSDAEGANEEEDGADEGGAKAEVVAKAPAKRATARGKSSAAAKKPAAKASKKK